MTPPNIKTGFRIFKIDSSAKFSDKKEKGPPSSAKNISFSIPDNSGVKNQ